MKIITLITVFLLFSCACGSEEREFDPELTKILRQYLRIAPTNGALKELVELKFGSTGDPKLQGVCEQSYVGLGKDYFNERRVTIEPSDNMGPQRVALVMHELAHCLHDKEHTDDPWSLMHPDRYGDDEYWQENLDERVREMFY